MKRLAILTILILLFLIIACPVFAGRPAVKPCPPHNKHCATNTPLPTKTPTATPTRRPIIRPTYRVQPTRQCIATFVLGDNTYCTIG